MPTFVPTCAHPMLGVESIGNRFLQAGHEIAIGIHGNFDGCVAKSLLNDLGLCAQLYEHGCMRMTKLVEATNGHSLVEAENAICYDIVRGYGLRRSLFWRRRVFFHGTKKQKTSVYRNV